MRGDHRERPPALPLGIMGVHLDHSTRDGDGEIRLQLDLDFEPPAGEAGQEFEFLVVAPEPELNLDERSLATLGKKLELAWEEEGHGLPVFRARAVLRRAVWHSPAQPDRSCSILGIAASLAVREVVRALAEERDARPVGREVLPRPPALPRTVPGVFVHHIKQTACSGPFAVVWADAEPLADDAAGDLELVDDQPPAGGPGDRGPLPAEFVAAFGAGVRDTLEFHGGGRPVYATRVVLRDGIWSETESAETGFRQSGWLAAMEILRCVADGREPRPAGCSSRRFTEVPSVSRARPVS